jgi:pimeloyl-ACP methyl ester carboxylesterase
MLRSNAARRLSLGVTSTARIQAGWRPAPNAASRGTRLRHGLATLGVAAAALCLITSGCGGDVGAEASAAGSVGATAARPSTPAAAEDLDRVVSIEGNRGLYVRCTGSGSPTVIMEGGDGDTSDSYAFAEPSIAKVTRTCVYDRANLGRSGSAPGPRGLRDLVGDLDRLLDAAQIPGPYVLVGTSGGGYITAGYAFAHPKQVAGMVFIDTGAPFWNPPREIVEETDPSNPENVERRDYLQVEKDAWAARKRVGDIPVAIMTVEYSDAAIRESPFPSERAGMRRNVENQKGWLVLSPRAKQIVVRTGHAVEEDDPGLVIDAILDIVKAA